MTRTMLVGFAVVGILGCGQGKAEVAADAPAAGPVSTTPSTRMLATGSLIGATMGQTISSRTNKAGEKVKNVRSAGFNAASTVELTITEITPAKNKSQADGTLTLQVTSVTVGGTKYPIAAEVTSVDHTLKGRGVTAGEVEKVAVGTAVGAVAGRIIGGNTKGAIIGGAVGAVGGTVVAIQTASRDVVVTAGTPLVITLTGPLTV